MHSILTAFVGQTAPDGAGGLGFLLPVVAMFVVFYFLLIRPQQKQAKKHQEFVTALQRGQEVFTQGGLIGRVHEVQEKAVVLDIGSGTKIRVVKGQVSGVWLDKPGEQAKVEAKK